MPASPSPKQTPALGMMLDALATMSSGLTMMSSAIEMMSEEATAKVENDSEKPVSPLVLPVRDSLNTASETEITAVPAGKGPSAQIEKNYMVSYKLYTFHSKAGSNMALERIEDTKNGKGLSNEAHAHKTQT